MMANQAGLAATGFNEEAVIGKTLAGIVPKDDGGVVVKGVEIDG